MKTAAIIRTWNSAGTLERVVGGLQSQTEPPEAIVVVDSGSDDDTCAIAGRLGCTVYRYPPDLTFNYSYAINLGVERTTQELILIISSHTVLAFRDVLAAMKAGLLAHDACGIYVTHRPSEALLPDEHDEVRTGLLDTIYLDNFDGFNGLWNCCSLVQRRFWELHPFDTTMPAAEDQEWALWHYRNTHRPTLRLRNPGVLYLNPHENWRKHARDFAVIASRLAPDLAGWKNTLRLVKQGCFSAVAGRFDEARLSWGKAYEVTRAVHLGAHYASRDHLRESPQRRPR